MPKYHFVKEQTIPSELNERTRLTLYYSSTGFEKADYFRRSEKVFSFKTCGNSIIFIDQIRKGLNKLHIGELEVNNPHLESSHETGITGPRLDLNRFDRYYADQRLKYLKRIQTARSRWKYVLEYAGYGRYTIPHRLRELASSPSTLEQIIEEHRKNRNQLSKSSQRDFVSDRTTQLEEQETILVKHSIPEEVKRLKIPDTKKGRKQQKIITSPEILSVAERLYSLTKETIEFVYQHPNFDQESARKYWENIYTLSERLNDSDFIKYGPSFIEHLTRHFPESQTPGSTFFKSQFPNAIAVIDFAFDLLRRDYTGEKITLVHEFPQPIGLDAVIALDELPPNVEMRTELRDELHRVNIVSGIPKKPTRQLTIIAGPTSDDRHEFKSIYPGKWCPENLEFWENHAFII